MLASLQAETDAMAGRAAALDAAEEFPSVDIRLLRQLGLLAAPLPRALGGEGLGTEPDGAMPLMEVLRTLGRGNLAVGRLYEAHVNALQLIVVYGTEDQRTRAAADARSGQLFGLWVTDVPGRGLVLDRGHLSGSKGPCSGAGQATRAVVTVITEGATRMAVTAVDGALAIEPARGMLQGMRACANGLVTFDGLPLPPESLLGGPGDYLREPYLSTGAWRTSAVTLGGLEALVAATGAQLRQKGHQDAPLQQDRFGRMLIAQETARLWTEAAADRAERWAGPVSDRVAYVNLARIAVETACLDAMRLAQRALGLAAFVRPNPVERLLRDLGVYLRQPAPDAVLTEAAQHALSA